MMKIDPLWNEDAAAALAGIERHLDQTGELLSSTGYFAALEQLPANIGKLSSNHVNVQGTRISDLSRLADVPSVTTLHVGAAVTDIAVLRSLPNLETFDAWRSPIYDLRPLAHHGCLKQLTLCVAALDDLSPLGTLPALETLILHDYSGQVLPVLPALVMLQLNTSAAVPRERGIDLPLLSQSSQLRTLIADRPLTHLPAALPALQTLFIDGSMLESLNPVGRYPALENLRVTHLRLDRLAPLAGCEMLETLDVRGAPVRDIRPLRHLRRLRDITIAETAIEEIVQLSHLPWAQESVFPISIDAANTPVSSLRGWNAASRVSRLDLSGTRITDVRPLAGSGFLIRLNLRGTPISDLTGIAGIGGLVGLDISGTQVTSLDEALRNRDLMVAPTLAEDPRDGGWFRFHDTPVARSSPELAAIAAMRSPNAALISHFGPQGRKEPAREPLTPQGWWRSLLGR